MNSSANTALCAASDDYFPQDLRIVYGVLLISFTLIGLISNLLLGAVLFYHNRQFLTSSICRVIFSMSLSSTTYFIVNIFIAIPAVCKFEIIPTGLVSDIITNLNTYTYYFTQSLLLVLCVNRFLILCAPFFRRSQQATDVVHLISWIYGILVCVLPILAGCLKVFSKRTLSFTFKCSQCGTTENVYVIAGEVVPIAMIIFYLSVFIKIRFASRKINPNTKRDLSLALQFLAICACSWFSTILFFQLPVSFPGQPWTTIVLTLGSCNGMTVNPVVLFIFNKKVRGGLMAMYRRQPLASSQEGVTLVTRLQQKRQAIIINSIDSNRKSTFGNLQRASMP